MTSSPASAAVWDDVRAMRPIIEATRAESDALRRLPDAVAAAFAERDVYRLVLPTDLGGRGVDPLEQFDLVEEVSSYDGSVGWNYGIGSNSGMLAGVVAPEVARMLFAKPGVGVVGSGAPQGRAVAVEGGYRVTGRFGWASGAHHASWLMGGCFVFDGEARRTTPAGLPVVVHVMVPRHEVELLDAWHVGGMRGTGSTTFVVNDVFVPQQHVFTMFGGEPRHPSPLYRLPTTAFGFVLTAVPLGVARATIEALKQLAAKKATPPLPGLAEQPFTQYTVAKASAMVEAARLGVREAFAQMWREVREQGAATLPSRAKLRGAAVHAVETSVEAVQQCYRAAGGTALFEEWPFERALRDVNAAAGHVVFQRVMMEDAGRVSMGLPQRLPMF